MRDNGTINKMLEEIGYTTGDVAEGEVKLGIQAQCLQSQLEGVYRQMYQACSQQVMVSPKYFPVCEELMRRANMLFHELGCLIAAYEEMARRENEEDTTLS